MATSIKLSAPDHKTVVRSVREDSDLTCVSTSAPDVYVNGILDEHQHTLYESDSMAVPAGTLTIRLFRKNPGNDPFSAELDLSVVPPKPESPAKKKVGS